VSKSANKKLTNQNRGICIFSVTPKEQEIVVMKDELQHLLDHHDDDFGHDFADGPQENAVKKVWRKMTSARAPPSSMQLDGSLNTAQSQPSGVRKRSQYLHFSGAAPTVTTRPLRKTSHIVTTTTHAEFQASASARRRGSAHPNLPLEFNNGVW